jgi:hypothetical protein
MEQKALTKGIYRLNLGIYFVFLGLGILALNSQYINTDFLIEMAVAMAVCIFIIFSGLREVNRHKAELKTDGIMRKIKYILVPNVLGFIPLGIGAYLLSLYRLEPFILPDGNTGFFYLHPYSSQALTLFLAGTGIEFLAVLLYYYLVPKQIVQEQKASPKLETPAKAQ